MAIQCFVDSLWNRKRPKPYGSLWISNVVSYSVGAEGNSRRVIGVGSMGRKCKLTHVIALSAAASTPKMYLYLPREKMQFAGPNQQFYKDEENFPESSCLFVSVHRLFIRSKYKFRLFYVGIFQISKILFLKSLSNGNGSSLVLSIRSRFISEDIGRGMPFLEVILNFKCYQHKKIWL